MQNNAERINAPEYRLTDADFVYVIVSRLLAGPDRDDDGVLSSPDLLADSSNICLTHNWHIDHIIL